MSISIPIESVTKNIQKLIVSTCSVKKNKTIYEEAKTMSCFKTDTENDIIHLPIRMYDVMVEHNLDIQRPLFRKRDFKYHGPVLFTIKTDPKKYRDQDVVFDHIIKELRTDYSSFGALPTGFGKTLIGINITCVLKYKTLILCYFSKVNQQWVDDIQKHTTAKVSYNIDEEADIYVMGIKKASNISKEKWDSLKIGFLILDEAHVATPSFFTDTVFLFKPRYFLALSATPDREDKQELLYVPFFGPVKNFITRKEIKTFKVVKYESDFEPEIKYMTVMGKKTVVWSTIKSSLELNQDRQKLIAKIASSYKDDVILILSYTVDQTLSIAKYLEKMKESVDSYCEDDEDFDENCRILVCGLKKGGVGFDDPRNPTLLILASDAKDVRQFEGRIRLNNFILVDIVDRYETLESHYGLREKWYLSRGGEIEIVKRKKLLEVKRRGRYVEKPLPRFLGRK